MRRGDSAGIDIGAEEIVVAIPPDRCPNNVRTFTSFTGDLALLRDWLLAHHITTFAMESTSNYWVNCYDILEAAGIECYLVNARHVKGVPGKNALSLDYPKQSQKYFATDLTLMDRIGPGVITALMSEIGSREHLLGSFKSADGFCAWLGLCPCNAIRGGKVLRSATRKVKNRLSGALRLAAFGLDRSKTKLGEYCRRMKGRLGKAECITATAHKLARILYTLIASGSSYDESQAFPVKPATQQKQLRHPAKTAPPAPPAPSPCQKTRPPSHPHPRSYSKLVKRTGTISGLTPFRTNTFQEGRFVEMRHLTPFRSGDRIA